MNTTHRHPERHHGGEHGQFGPEEGAFGGRGARGGFGGPWEGMLRGRGFRGPRGGFGPGFGGPGFGGPGFDPSQMMRGFGHHGPRARRGDVRSAILGLLADGPSNGYGLIKAIGERTEGGWTPSPGSVYPTLAQLVDEGLVAQTDGPRGAYSLTEAGTAYVAAHRDEIDAAFANARGTGADDELFTAFRKLAGAAMQFRAADAAQKARATEKVDELRRELYRILGE